MELSIYSVKKDFTSINSLIFKITIFALFFLNKNENLNKTNQNTTKRMVEVNGIEPMTSCLQSTRSPN